MTLRSTFVVLAAILMIGCAAPPAVKKPSRVAIKNTLDADASKINREPKEIAIEDLIALGSKVDKNVDLSEHLNDRIDPVELTTYAIHGRIKSVVHRKDGDYVLTIVSPSGAEAIVEVPDPKLCKGSPLEGEITAARKYVEDKYHPSDTPKEVDDPANIEGVGFLGFRGKPGAGGSSSKTRIMPGTKVTVGQ